MKLVGKAHSYYLPDVNYLWCIKDVKLQHQNPAYYPWEMLSENMHAIFEPLSDFFKLLQPYYLDTIVLLKAGLLWVYLSLGMILKRMFLFSPHPSLLLLSCFLSTSAGVCNSFITGVALSISHVGSWAKLTHLPVCCLARQELLPGIQVGCRVWGTGD